MPKTNKHIRVKIVIDSTTQLQQNEPIKYKEEQTAKQQQSVVDPQSALFQSYNSGQFNMKN